jgi:hypothetical protein
MRAARHFRISLVVWSVCLLPATVLAQGAVGGVVRDASGGVLPGVTVEAASPALIERVRSGTTDNSGQYLLVDLRPGVYTVTFTLPGFTTFRREGLEVTTGVTLPINAELTVGAIEETVIVTTATPVVDIQNTRQQTVLPREVLDVLPRTRVQQQTGALLPGVTLSGGGAGDVAGSSGRHVVNISIHGGDTRDQIHEIDGMKVIGGSNGDRRLLAVADNTAQEYTYVTSAHSADVASGGIRMNLVPKEGGNKITGTAYADFTNESLLSDNLSEDLKSRGLTTTTGVEKIWDVSPALGGPLIRDRLWFFATYRHWGANYYPADTFYLSDPTRRGIWYNKYWAADGRLTWQATKRNKFNVYYNHQGRDIPYFGINSTVPPEAASGDGNNNIYLIQPKWSSPISSRLLAEAGMYYYHDEQPLSFSRDSRLQAWVEEPADPLAWPTFEISTGKWIAGSRVDSTFFPSTPISNWLGASGSLSYVTGSHALKVGFTHISGTYWLTHPPVPPILRMLNGVPFQVQLIAKPGEAKPRLNHDLGLYAQDQWTFRQLTLNLGLRFDYLNGQVDAQYAPAGRWFLPERQLREINDVPNWKDISPRIGLAYDLFGNGKTALKSSVSRYVAAEAVNFQGLVNPMGGPYVASLTDQRTWNDRNGDRLPQDAELGPSTNLNFGTFALNTRPDEELREGWGKRGYNWEYAVSIQQELLSGLSLTVGYFRRWYGNLQWTDNLLVEETDYSPLTIVSPYDGDQVTLYNLNPARRGLSDNVIKFAPNDSRVFNGVDVLVNGRFGRGGFVGGGVSLGRTVTETCTTDNPNARLFCTVTPPFFAGNQYKFVVAYPLPYGVQVSSSFQSIPGPVITANYTVSSAVAGAPLTLGSLAVNLIEPGTMYNDRLNQVDLRVGRNFAFRGRRLQPYIDIFNAFNASPVVGQINTYGPNWQRPSAILIGRMVKFGVQFHF